MKGVATPKKANWLLFCFVLNENKCFKKGCDRKNNNNDDDDDDVH